MPTEPFVTGEVVVATDEYTAGSTPSKDLIFAYPYRTTDGTPVNNSTTLVADDVLKFSIGVSQVWAFEARIFWNSASKNLKLSFSGPAAVTFVKFGIGYSDEVGGEVATAFDDPLVATNAGGDGPNMFLPVYGIVSNGVNAGTVTFEFAQAAPGMEDTKLLKGSYLIPRRLA